jgi:hypothetical protein
MFDNPSHTVVSLDYAERSSNFIVRAGDGASHIGFSFDGGSNWFQASAEPAGTNGGGVVAAAADGSRVVWSPVGGAVSFSTNNGSSWTTSAGIPAGARVISDRVNPLKFYGFANGTIYLSTNGGVSFTATAASGLPANAARFKAVPGREGDLWLAGDSGGLWHSINNGASFGKLGNVEEGYDIGFGMAAPGQTYLALYTSARINGIQGLFRSDDGGASWIRINDDQHQYGITSSITGDPRVYGRVYFGTNGRGILQGDIRTQAAGTGGVTITPVVNANGPFFSEEAISLSNTGTITALTITIVLQRTPGLTFNGMFNTVGGIILQSSSSTATTFTAQFTLAAGATLGGPGTNRLFAVQTGAGGTTHVTTGDTFTVTYTTGGQSFTQTGHF